MSRRQHWYHCSVTDHGPELVVLRQYPKIMDKREPLTPRLCVSSTVPACLVAVTFAKGPVHVYRTKTECRGVTPRDVWDSAITDEKWLLPKTVLVKYDLIEEEAVLEIKAFVLYFIRQGIKSNLHQRAAQYAWVLGNLPERFITPHDRRRVRFLKRYLEFDDPVKYLQSRVKPTLAEAT